MMDSLQPSMTSMMVLWRVVFNGMIGGGQRRWLLLGGGTSQREQDGILCIVVEEIGWIFIM